MQEHTAILLDLPLKTVSEINRHEHWRRRQKRVKAQRREVWAEWKNNVKGRVKLPCKVILTRVGPKTLDSDNLYSALKAVRDEVAQLLGVKDDPDSPAQFECRQKAIGEHSYRVIIEVQSL